MSKKDQAFQEYIVKDLLGDFEGITSRAMFGGWGIYEDGLIFAIIVEGEIYFKVDDSNRADFEELGSHPFVYEQSKGKSVSVSYWLLPAEVQEDHALLREFVSKAIAVSRRAKAKKGKKKLRLD